MIFGKKPTVDPLYQAYGPGTPFSSGAAFGTAFDDEQSLNLGEAFGRNVLQRALRNPDRFTPEKIQALQALGFATDEEAGYLRDAINSPMLTAEQANEEFSANGALHFDAPIRRTEAKFIYDNKVKSIIRNERLSRADGGVFNTVGRFIAGMAASTLDPGELAINFVPAAGIAKKLGYLKNAGVFSRGAIDATAGALLTRPFVAYQSAQEQGDYGVLDVMQDLAFGIVVGGGLPAAFNKVGEFRARRSLRRSQQVFDAAAEKTEAFANPVDFDVTDSASLDRALSIVDRDGPSVIVKKTDPEITQAAIGQMVDRQSVDVGEIAILRERVKLRDVEDKVGDFDLYRSINKQDEIALAKVSDAEDGVTYSSGDVTVKSERGLLPEDLKEIMRDVADIVATHEPIARGVDGSFRYVFKDGENVIELKATQIPSADGAVKRYLEIKNAAKDAPLSNTRTYEIPENRITDAEVQQGFDDYVARKKLENKPIRPVIRKRPANQTDLEADVADAKEAVELAEGSLGKMADEEKQFLNDMEGNYVKPEEQAKTAQAAATCIIGAL